MSWFSLIGIELKKLRRSHIFWLLLAPLLVLWIPMVINSGMNFNMQAEGISPEHNFLVQSLMGLAWFMFPASLVVETVLLNQTERGGRGMLKMLTLPEMCIRDRQRGSQENFSEILFPRDRGIYL